MTQMSDLRQAAEQALQALEELQYAVVGTAKTDDVSLYYRAIAALSAALAEPTCKQSLQVATAGAGAHHRSRGMGSQGASMTIEQAARDFFGWFNRHYPAPSTNPDHEWNRLGVALTNHQEEAQPAPHPAITHCDNCGCSWLDDGLNPIGCPYCKQSTASNEALLRMEEREQRDEALLREALYALEYASDLTQLNGLQGCECPICTNIAALRERLGEGEQR